MLVAIVLEVYALLIVFIVVDTPGVVSTFSVVLGRIRASRRRSVATQLTVGGRASRRAHWINVLQFLFVTRDESFLAFFFCPPPFREEICLVNRDKLISIASKRVLGGRFLFPIPIVDHRELRGTKGTRRNSKLQKMSCCLSRGQHWWSVS